MQIWNNSYLLLFFISKLFHDIITQKSFLQGWLFYFAISYIYSLANFMISEFKFYFPKRSQWNVVFHSTVCGVQSLVSFSHIGRTVFRGAYWSNSCFREKKRLKTPEICWIEPTNFSTECFTIKIYCIILLKYDRYYY